MGHRGHWATCRNLPNMFYQFTHYWGNKTILTNLENKLDFPYRSKTNYGQFCFTVTVILSYSVHGNPSTTPINTVFSPDQQVLICYHGHLLEQYLRPKVFSYCWEKWLSHCKGFIKDILTSPSTFGSSLAWRSIDPLLHARIKPARTFLLLGPPVACSRITSTHTRILQTCHYGQDLIYFI